MTWYNLHITDMLVLLSGGGGGGREGVLPRKLGKGVRPASQNPYPIYELNSAIFPTLFMT